VQYGVGGALALLFLWIAFRGTDFPKLVVSIGNANYWWIGASAGCLMLSHVVRAWRWRYLLAPLKQDTAFRNLFAGVIIGYAVNNVLPRAGELARPFVIGRLERIPRSAAFGTIIVERIIDIFSFLFLVALLPLIYDGPLLDSFPWLQRAGIVLTVVTTATLTVLIVMMVRRDWTNRLLRIAGRALPERLAAKVDTLVHGFLNGFLFLKHPANFSVIVLSSAVVWFLYIMVMYLAFFAFGIENLGFRAAVAVQTISSIGVAIPTPGGTGSYHAFTSQALSKLFGVDSTVALSYATVTHAAGYLCVTIGGVYFFLRDHFRVAEVVGRSGGGTP
jgi:uncharacterized protein (TIRG00374 family)